MRDPRFRPLAYVVGAIVAALVIVPRIYDAFSGDQALFTLGGQAMRSGAVLYRDFWDLKQPGIYYFYEGAGSLFGFSAIGIHIFELIWQLGFSFAMYVCFRRRFADRRIAALGAFVYIFAYYAGSRPKELAQVEALIGLPLFLCFWTADAALRRSRIGLGLIVLSGLLAGSVLLFKFLFVVILVPTLAVVAIVHRRRHAPAKIAGAAVVLLIASAVPLVVYAASVAAHHIEPLVFDTFFRMPVRYVAYFHAPPKRLALSIAWFVVTFTVFIVVGGYGLAARSSGAEEPHEWRPIAATWLASAFVTILLQRSSWYPYQLMALLPPLVIASMFGVASFVQQQKSSPPRVARSRQLRAIAVIAILSFGMLIQLGSTEKRFLQQRPFVSRANDIAYGRVRNPEFAEAWIGDAYLRSHTLPERGIFVCGSPQIYLLSDYTSAIALSGWTFWQWIPSQWIEFDDQLSRAGVRDVYMSLPCLRDMQQRSPQTAEAFGRQYREIATSSVGNWYRRV